MTVQLESQDRQTVYAAAEVPDVSAAWQHPKITLTSNFTDANAQLTLYIHGKADVSVRMLSLFPAENVKGDVLQPFRSDILGYLKDLKPRSASGLHARPHALARKQWTFAVMVSQCMACHTSHLFDKLT